MKLTRFSILACAFAALTACSATEVANRSVAFVAPDAAQSQATLVRSYSVAGMTFVAPADLDVSEHNGYYPIADIVWRGDPLGNRKAQIEAMFRTAMDRAAPDLDGDTPVEVAIELVRFHGVTERTRFSFGGVYDVVFNMTVRNAATGEIIEPARRLHKTLPAPGGAAAILAEQQGQTEKVRMVDFLTVVLRDELTGSGQT